MIVILVAIAKVKKSKHDSSGDSESEEKVPIKRYGLRDRSIIKPAKRPGQDSETEAVDQATTKSKTALLLSPGDNLVLEDLKPALTTNCQKLPT